MQRELTVERWRFCADRATLPAITTYDENTGMQHQDHNRGMGRERGVFRSTTLRSEKNVFSARN